MPLQGQIFPGTWDFVVGGIYDGKNSGTDTAQMFFHWDYLNEEIKRRKISRDLESVGVFIVEVNDVKKVGPISQDIDELFKNSRKETYTETEKAFQLGFVAMTEAIVVAIRLVSYVVIVIIMLVMANTMVMTSKERMWEYATMRSLGFDRNFLNKVIFFESLFLSGIGGLTGIVLTFPAATLFRSYTGTLFPVFEISLATISTQICFLLLIGLVASLFPAWKASNGKIVTALRAA